MKKNPLRKLLAEARKPSRLSLLDILVSLAQRINLRIVGG
jgi:hypothetical protein